MSPTESIASQFPGDEVPSGELWLADLDSRGSRALTSSAGYLSPVFLPGTKDILALQGTDAVRVPAGGGECRRQWKLARVRKG